MNEAIAQLHRRQNRNKIVVFTIVAFLALLTYLLIVVSQMVTEQAFTTGSEASSGTYMTAYQRAQSVIRGDTAMISNDGDQATGDSIQTENLNNTNNVNGQSCKCVIDKEQTLRQSNRCDIGDGISGTIIYTCAGVEKKTPTKGCESYKLAAARIGYLFVSCPADPGVTATPAPTAIPTVVPLPTTEPTATQASCHEVTFERPYNDAPFYRCTYTCSNGDKGYVDTFNSNNDKNWCIKVAKTACGCKT